MISDTGPLIHLAKLERLSLLRELFGTVYITSGVYEEAVIRGKKHGHEDAEVIERAIRDGWIVVIPRRPYQDVLQLALAHGLDRGETEAISLARLSRGLLLIDEKKGREVARRLGVEVMGTIGVILLAVKKRLISREGGCVKILKELPKVMYVSESLIEKAVRSLITLS